MARWWFVSWIAFKERRRIVFEYRGTSFNRHFLSRRWRPLTHSLDHRRV
jgi:hypothetical protein